MSFFVADALWLMFPAYVANSSAVLFAGTLPIDLGKKFSDGRRILGPGKTFRGLIGGTMTGVTVGVIQQALRMHTQLGVPSFDPIFVVITLSFGALLGDIVKSFFKRRLGFEKGASFPIADQYDFVAGALLFTYIFFPEWLTLNFVAPVLIAVIVLTAPIHLMVNYLGFRLGKKDVWW
jgi:CDP-2,3-bis-(O-geranylgeranyl)-sn-glycerol synthase